MFLIRITRFLRSAGFFAAVLLLPLILYAQQKAVIYGKITAAGGKPIDLVNVSVFGMPYGTSTDKNGQYTLHVPADLDILVVFSFIGYKKISVPLKLPAFERRQIDQQMEIDLVNMTPFEFTADKIDRGTIQRINPKDAGYIPSPSGDIIGELVKKTGLGIYSNNELSSQYSVRGGNFDENLVYVNDVEIYRPFLTRSGQQEGLSFVNSDLVDNVLFSSGGFDAKYGDKMSSVLDITYKKPRSFGGSVDMSLLGAAAHLEGATNNERLTWLIGVRQKSNQYILNKMDTKGQYKPSFTDVQGCFNYQVSENMEMSVLGNYARNKYLVIPESRETTFGTIQESYKLKIYFEGREVDRIDTYFGAWATTWTPNNKLKLKFIASAFNTDESEAFDLNGQYLIGRLETDFSKENFGEVTENLGVGTHFSHARNNLSATVYNAEHRGALQKGNSFLQWGLKYQGEIIADKLREWQMIDSAGYTLVRPPDSVGYQNSALQAWNPLELQDVVRTNIDLFTNRVSGFFQDTWSWNPDSVRITLTAGLRASFWTNNKEVDEVSHMVFDAPANFSWTNRYNKQIDLSPRITATIKPHVKSDVLFRVSAGVYNQPPFYKELRGFDGVLNPELRAQTSYHFVLGTDWNFIVWNRPFKFVSEVYYKYLDHLVPYKIDNVRIRYFATNNAHGYATGLDMKINGQFVRDAESWLGLSLMQTREDIKNDYYYVYYNKDGEEIIKGYTLDQVATDSVKVEPGYVPRPTDQLLTVNLFFQDYLPKFPTYRMHLNFVYSTGLAFGPPGNERYKDTLRGPSYFRVDIGFSKALIGESRTFKMKNPLRFIHSMWISAEVFNLLGRLNTISYLWIKDVTNRTYAVPNELTRRMINVKLSVKF